MRINYQDKKKLDFYFDLSILTSESMKIYEKSVAKFVDESTLTIESNRTNLYTQLGLLAIYSQFAERQFFIYAFLYEEFGKLSQIEIISRLQEIIIGGENMIMSILKSENQYTQFRDSLIKFSETITLNENFMYLAHRAIDDRNYLIHHCVIGDPTLLYDKLKIKDMTIKAIYCNTILNQIYFETEKIFIKAITNNYPKIAIKLNELNKTINNIFRGK